MRGKDLEAQQEPQGDSGHPRDPQAQLGQGLYKPRVGGTRAREGCDWSAAPALAGDWLPAQALDADWLRSVPIPGVRVVLGGLPMTGDP